MTTGSFRLDSFSVQLVERLEPVRRAHVGDALAAREAFAQIVAEASRAVAQECLSTLGDAAHARRIEREAVGTFLPRYTRLALEQNLYEAATPWLLRPGLFNRALALVLSGFLVTASVELVRRPWVAVLYVFVVLAPLLPELRSWSSRSRYQAQLQELTDDMLQLQRADEALSASPDLDDPAISGPAVAGPAVVPPRRESRSEPQQT